MHTLAQDLAYAFRMLRKSPMVTAVAVFSLALGIGATSAMFSWLDGLVLSPLRVHEPERLVHLYSTNLSGFLASYSYLNYRDERDRSEAFDGLVAFRAAPLSFSEGRESERIFGQIVSGNFWQVMGVEAAEGRTFTPEEDEAPGRDPVVVLSHGFWQRRFASNPAAVGSTIQLNGRPFTVLGVLPKDYAYATVAIEADVYAPLTMMGTLVPGADRLGSRGWGFLDVVGRLKPGVGIEQAQAHMEVVARELASLYPDENEDRTVRLIPESRAILPQDAQGPMTSTVAVLMGVVAFVLLIACANVANLQLARAKAREVEMGVRLALGAGRSRLLRLLLTESVVLSAIAGLLGIGLAFALNQAVKSISLPVGAPVAVDVRLDTRVLAFTTAVALLSAMVFGLAPALRAARLAECAASTRVVSRSRFGSILVAGQMALSLVLLIGASLFLESLRAAQSIDPGFEADGVLLAAVDPNLQGYDRQQAGSFYESLSERASSLSGVVSVGLAENVPIQFANQQWGVEIEGYVPAPDERMNIDYNIVTPGYFETLAIPLLRGRDFGAEDQAEGQGSLIVNQSMARRLWPDSDALGKRVRTGGMDRIVVGIVADSKVYSLGEGPFAFMYLPYEQMSHGTALTLFVRTRENPLSIVEPLRAEVRALDALLPLYDVETLHERLAFGLLPSRLSASILGAFGFIALVMASIGLYGVTAYSVSQRTREIGLRMALGAGAPDVVRLVLRRVVIMAIAGLTLGMAGGVLLGRLAQGLLFGTGASDATTYLGAGLVIALAALLSGYLPARRASGIDPMSALRYP
ncbi:MAG: ABC transporter permease [Vicinamibacteria bacterium]